VTALARIYGCLALLLITSLPCPSARSQEPTLADQIEALRETVVRQQTDLDKQQEQIASQLVLIDKLRAQLRAQGGLAPGSPSSDQPPAEENEVALIRADAVADAEVVGPNASGGQKAAIAELERREIEGVAAAPVDSQRTLFDPSNFIFDPDFPGAWHLPGTTAAMKIGGYANLAIVNNFDPLLARDRFIVGTIPTSGQTDPGARKGASVTASQTRFNIEIREHTEQGQLRAFIEGDFLGERGDGASFRLRHAYGQYRWLLAGQTWTVLSNLEALPEQVDFEGINGAVLARQPQVRFFPRLGKDLSLVMSIENPETNIDQGVGVTELPDLILSVNKLPLTSNYAWNYKVGAIVRDLRGKADVTNASPVRNAIGWGLTTSGRVPAPVWSDSDNVAWQITYGSGVGRYLNDLNAIGGGDAVFDSSGDLRPLPVLAGFLSFQHEWNSSWLNRWPGLWRSNLNLSWIDIANYDFQEGSAYNQTMYTSANLIYFPTQNARVGLEFLWGQRKNKDNSRGTARQIQLSTRFTF